MIREVRIKGDTEGALGFEGEPKEPWSCAGELPGEPLGIAFSLLDCWVVWGGASWFPMRLLSVAFFVRGGGSKKKGY